ncbi:hypothetical protein [Aureibacter tunicatorum]|uniref:Uncharacterized protein n=1 Tax=Aureibacter tunicatorum TaxID=866807 RepID=A0AAE3XRD4_9BACT|nr:hypothetical protein [Aureibacter tunicatorum]MDR6241353.1 hypothetical protein [Aureibacter tunicatorum]BDD03612.1 hypothetical protein AUTU_10950 [Aureibacter tunicatorum]
MCQSWELNKSEIKKVFAESRAINGPEWHHLFGVLPCQIIGTISQNDQQYEFSINSGAWVTVSSSDTTLLFGNFEKANNKYFLMEALEENE